MAWVEDADDRRRRPPAAGHLAAVPAADGPAPPGGVGRGGHGGRLGRQAHGVGRAAAAGLRPRALGRRSRSRSQRLAQPQRRGGRGRARAAPATVMWLAGDVHHSYLAEARPARRARRAGWCRRCARRSATRCRARCASCSAGAGLRRGQRDGRGGGRAAPSVPDPPFAGRWPRGRGSTTRSRPSTSTGRRATIALGDAAAEGPTGDTLRWRTVHAHRAVLTPPVRWPPCPNRAVTSPTSRPARDLLEGVVGDHAGRAVAVAGRSGRAPSVPQVREPAAHRLVQDPRRLRAHRRLSDDERARGVVAASAGNHAQGVALAALDARRRGHRVHARGRADPQGEGDPRLRRRRAVRRRPTSTTR